MGMYDGLELATDTAQGVPPRLPKAPSMYDGLELAPIAPAREPTGALESLQAGWQASAPGLAWRGKLPDLISNPEHSKWWERALTGVAQVGAELPLMAVGAAAGAPAGAILGTAIAPGPGTAVGSVLGAGAGMFALPAAIRESLIQAYQSGEIKTGADYWNILRAVATETVKQGAIGAVTFGAGGVAARTVGKALVPAIGERISVPTAVKAIGGTETAAQIAAMVSMPAALQGRLPDAQEFMDAAIVIGGLKAALPLAARISNVFVKTGKTPAEQVADTQADPSIAADLTKPAEPAYRPEMAPQATEMAGARLAELKTKSETAPLTDAERAERIFLTNAKPEALAAHFKVKLVPSLATSEESAQRVYADVLRQISTLEQDRVAAGLQPIYDRPPEAIAALVRHQVSTMAAMHGVMPEEIYRERYVTLRDATQAQIAAEEAVIPPEVPRFAVPEVDLFGNPVEAPRVPRFAVENLATQELPLEKLTLSKDVPQFKAAANEQGVIVPLGGRFDRTGVGPIQVWERTDGTLEVISGRHRLDLARRSGETTIPAQVHREAEGFNVQQAATLDAQLNIREEQGSVADYAQYFKDAGISKAAADELGLLARAKGRTGYAIARDASPDLLAAHRAGLLSDEAALSISSAAAGSARLQALGMAMVNEGKSILMAVNTMKAVDLMAAERVAAGVQGDIFGFDDSAMREAATMAKRASSRQRKIGEQISAVAGASRHPELARKMGVDVTDPEGIQKRIVELRQEQYLWDNWPLHSELVAKLREPELKQGPVDEFHRAGEVVDGRIVRDRTPNESSISASLTDYTVQPGVREIPLSAFDPEYKPPNTARVRELAEQIKESGEINPLIVVKDADGLYILEGANRFDALLTLGAKSFPAKLVFDNESLRKAPEDFRLAAETPAELKARDEEAVAQAKRKLAEERAAELKAQGKPLTAEQTDLFEPMQTTLFQEHRAAYDIENRLITTFEKADQSSILHELGHHFLEDLKYYALKPNAPERVTAMWETARREFAIPASGEISTASHEMNARSFERYLAEGEAPTPELRSMFEQFKQWMLAIYSELKNIGAKINPEIRQLFDQMLATEDELAAAKQLNVPRAYVPEAMANEARKIVPGFKAEQISMQPFADELPKGPGQAPDTSHVNYAYINSPMDVKLTMQRMAEIDQEAIQKQRGGIAGVKSWAESNAEQAKYVNDILGGTEDTLKLLSPRDPEAPGPDVRLGVLKKLAVGAVKDSARLRDVVLEAGHDATVRQQLEYMGSIERARMIQAEFLGERASVARALNALKDVTEGSGEIGRMLEAIGTGELYQTVRTPAEEQIYLKAKLDEILLNYRGKTVLDIAKLHKEIGTLKGTFKMVKGMEQATTWEMVIEAWKSGLLSGPVTHTTNLFGTGAFQVLRAPVDLLASIIGMARGASVGMGESDRASMSESVARISGYLGGIQDGLTVGYHSFKADEVTGKTESFRKAIPGQAGDIIRIPLRLMAAEDAIVNTMYKRGEMKTLAIRHAFDENMSPSTREFAERVDYLMDHPTPAMESTADAAAIRMTFNYPLGEKGVALQLFVNKWNLQWMIPFIRTPINIAKELARMSPFAPVVGEWRTAIAKGGVERDRALAEIILGSGIMAVTMAYAFQGNISGAGSPDPGKNRGKAGVWQPYSILVGDKWYEYGRIQPTGTLMGMAADLANVWDHMTEEEKDKVPKMLATAFANAVTNQTFLQGLTNFVNTLSDPGRYGERFIHQMAASLVPNVIGQPTAMADPMVREINSSLEAIQARIPGMRQDLLPKRDWLGEAVQTKERAGVIMPVREQPVSEDKVRLEAARLDISMAAAPKKTHIGKGTGKLGEVELTPEERDTFAKVGGEMAHMILTNIVNADGYDSIPDLIKRRIFAKVLEASHRVAAVAALPMDKRIAYIQSISEKIAAELQPGETE